MCIVHDGDPSWLAFDGGKGSGIWTVLQYQPNCIHTWNVDYRDQETAKKCEAWCKEHQSCNLEITRESVERSRKYKPSN